MMTGVRRARLPVVSPAPSWVNALAITSGAVGSGGGRQPRNARKYTHTQKMG